MSPIDALLRLARGVLLSALVALAACAPSPPPRAGEPALWHARSPSGGEAWLFGSVHRLPPGVRWRGPALVAATARADRLIVEAADAGDAALTAHLFAQLGSAVRPVALDRRLPADLRATADRLRAQAGLSPDDAARLDSWALALRLSASGAGGLRLSTDAGVEAVLSRAFLARGRPVEGLEGAARQMRLFEELSEKDQRALLATVVRQAPVAARDYDAMLDAWLRGDLPALERSAAVTSDASPALREALLVRRNRAWCSEIARRVAAGQRPFVAVGAAHLIGRDGVVALLRQRGWRVVRVDQSDAVSRIGT